MAALLKLCGPEFRDNFVAQKFSRRKVVPATESAQAAELTQRPGPSSTVSMDVRRLDRHRALSRYRSSNPYTKCSGNWVSSENGVGTETQIKLQVWG
ncbi:hypothetical protein DPMN_151102 [Dreissena polymorpha]|uniref:Uncharacterized protein n=1 Tax=Dreissena polymorpha TaxID=45954 RepID=A0A9D4FGI1_DREPO|nr:hypothetical protein DPMN_151102 [Dreissena polymorpha]